MTVYKGGFLGNSSYFAIQLKLLCSSKVLTFRREIGWVLAPKSVVLALTLGSPNLQKTRIFGIISIGEWQICCFFIVVFGGGLILFLRRQNDVSDGTLFFGPVDD